ncbi:MAG: hypothetical protein Q8K77_03330, partial [Thermodesulfovibrionales bacterium]|nr:hypothetical protein [Thermodesulfovibrionales bacterium]
EDIIKVQHNCSPRRVRLSADKATGFWVKKSKLYNFLLIMHEHLFVFQKKSTAASSPQADYRDENEQ